MNISNGTNLIGSNYNLSLGSLYIISGGLYNATTGTTTLTSENPDGRALDNLGTITHNSGRVNITATSNVTINTGKDSLFNLQIAAPLGNITLLNDTDLIGGLNITTGTLDTNTSFGHRLTATNAVIITGTLHGRNSSNITLGGVIISSTGTFNATTETMLLTKEITSNGMPFDNDGIFTANNGTINITNSIGDDTSFDLLGLNNGNIWNLNILNTFSNYYGSNGGQIDNNFYANNANFRASSVGAVSDFNVTGNLRLENSAGWGNNGDTGNQRFGSITILSTANIRATAGTTTLTSENTEGIVLDNRGTITHNSGLFNITTTTNTTINTGANSLFNLQIAAPLGNVTLLNNIDLVGGLNITNGTLDTNTSFGYRLSSASPAVISGTLNGRNSSNITLAALTINSGGTYNATSNITTLSSEDPLSRTLDNLGTIVHNSGLFNITGTTGVTINTGKDSLFNLQIATGTGNVTLLNDTDLMGGLNITTGILDTNTSFGHGLTSTNLVILDGTLHTRNSSNISLSALTINSAGTYNATLSTTNITNGNWTNGGSFTHNAGIIMLGGGTSENQTIGGNNETTFFNLNITNGVVAVTQEQNTTIEGVLDIGSLAGLVLDATDKVLAATFGNASGGNTKIINSGTLGFAGNRINFVKIIGARGQNPITISGTDWDWDSGGSGSAVNISNVDYQIDATTGGGGVTVILDGTSVNLNDFILTAGDSLNATKSGLIITIGNVTADQLSVRGTINFDSVIINSYYSLLIATSNAIIDINNISWKSANDYGIQFNAQPTRIRQLNNSIFRSGSPYAGMFINYVGNKPVTGTNNTFVGTAGSNNVYGQDIYLQDNTKAELTNSTFTTVGFIGPTGYLISKDHNKVTNNWTIWGMLDTTTGNSTGGYNGTNWTASDSINLALATRYTNYFPSNLNATNNFVVGGMNISNGTNLIGSNYNLSLGSLYVISGGLYNATTGTTT